MKSSNERVGAESALMIGSVVGFVVFFVAAAHAYPGGTHFDHASVGHDFWRNTLCDVARTVGIDGAPNAAGCLLARLAMTILALGIGVFFFAVARLFPAYARLGAAVRALGAASIPFTIAVVFLPTDRFSQLHGVAIVLAGILGLGAVSLALKGLFGDARAPGVVVALGVVTLSVAAVDFGLYVAEFLSGGPAQVAVPILERLTTILILVWMVSVARAVHRLRVRSLDARPCRALHARHASSREER